MKSNVRDIIEYIIAVINGFSKRYGLSEKQAYLYIRAHKGVGFIEENYNIIHTLNFNEAIESVALYCRRTGGTI